MSPPLQKCSRTPLGRMCSIADLSYFRSGVKRIFVGRKIHHHPDCVPFIRIYSIRATHNNSCIIYIFLVLQVRERKILIKYFMNGICIQWNLRYRKPLRFICLNLRINQSMHEKIKDDLRNLNFPRLIFGSKLSVTSGLRMFNVEI